MITRSVPIHEDAIRDIENLGTDLLLAGDIRASLLLTLALAWKYAPPPSPDAVLTPSVNDGNFRCNIDESAGLAEVYALDSHSRRV